ncbi:MAG: hypothetical protein Q8K98_00865 [Bacteroidota bacterium]|nr:hypothetical protein [Bacteroidota bacterium]
MKNKRKELKEFLKLYNRFIYSIVNQNDNKELQEFPDEIITDEELDFLLNISRGIEKPINKKCLGPPTR